MARPSPATGLRLGGQVGGLRFAGQAGRLRPAGQSGSVLDPVGVRSSRRRRQRAVCQAAASRIRLSSWATPSLTVDPRGRRSTAARCTFEGGSPPTQTRQWAVGDAHQKTVLPSTVPSVPATGLRSGGQASGFRPAGWQTGFGPPARMVRFRVPATPPKGPRAGGRERRGTRSGRSSLLPFQAPPPCVGIRERRRSVSVGSRRRAHRTFGSDQLFASCPARSAGRLRATCGSPSGARCRETGGTVERRGFFTRFSPAERVVPGPGLIVRTGIRKAGDAPLRSRTRPHRGAESLGTRFHRVASTARTRPSGRRTAIGWARQRRSTPARARHRSGGRSQGGTPGALAGWNKPATAPEGESP
jgi:hypothetical protein